jgi:hypothetical protein
LQEEFRKNLKHQRIKSIARLQKKLESSKNQVYCKSSEKTSIIKESILLQEFRKNLNRRRINPKQTPRNPSKFRGKKEGKKEKQGKKKKKMMMKKECKSRDS